MTERSNVHAAIEAELICPNCHEQNKTNAAPMIVYDLRFGTAFCAKCAHAGPLVTFQPQGV